MTKLRGAWFACLFLLVANVRADECKTPEHWTAQDGQDVRALARQLGIPNPVRMCEVMVMQPIGCIGVEIDAETAVQGQRRSWLSLMVQRNPPEAALTKGMRSVCPMFDRGAERVAVGGWVSSTAQLKEKVFWRLTLENGTVDAVLGEGVTVAMA